ncbi:hypothetical protein FA95DRAFT_1542131 [Auriscalpium vulgare]|uniref:Uncharacterized protein n=1 Tax=Auriscalpium vulgare TaxID=40419 RepID=A0ACB8RS94_9AGAM|nr:hypothetical protein FA95DRAFT_1542131 [Auriscalpium vulgare]
MQAPGGPVSMRHDGLEGHDTIWMNAARCRITQLEAGHISPFHTRHATIESADAAERALSDMQDAHRARFKAEEDAMEAAKEEVRKAYAVEDEAMSAARRAVRQERNSILPVARLPPEVLRTIFTVCSDIDHPLIEGWDFHFGWLAVTHVCRRWRDIALEHSGLWADVLYPLGPLWAAASLERAQTMPLIVHFELYL